MKGPPIGAPSLRAFVSSRDAILTSAATEIRAIAPEALRAGPDAAIFITEAQAIDLDGLSRALRRKLAKLRPTDPWVEVLDVDSILECLGMADGSEIPDVLFAPLDPATREPPPPGAVRFVIVLGSVFETFVAEVATLLGGGGSTVS